MSRLESAEEREFVRWCKSQGIITLKQNANWYANIPDRLVMLPGGHAFFLEFKRLGEVLRGGQRKRMRLLQRMGYRAFWTDSVEGAKYLVQCEKDYHGVT